MGTHHYGIDLPPAERIAQSLAPQEGTGPLHKIPFDQLAVGVLDIHRTDAGALPEALGAVFSRLKHLVEAAKRRGDLPDATGILMVEDWQAGLKRVTLRIGWQAPGGNARKTLEKLVHLHQER
jgi:hypothetical protein